MFTGSFCIPVPKKTKEKDMLKTRNIELLVNLIIHNTILSLITKKAAQFQFNNF